MFLVSFFSQCLKKLIMNFTPLCIGVRKTEMETLTQYRSRYYHQLISYNLFLPCAQATATRIYVQMEWTDSENTSFFGHVRQPAAATFRSQPKTWIRNLLIKIPFCSKIVTELFSSFQQFKAEIIEQKNKTIYTVKLKLNSQLTS